jgi:hypothetical protein
VGRVAVGQPVNGIVEIGGPEQFRVDELVQRRLAWLKDPREVIPDPNALYSGAKLSDKTLVPGTERRRRPFDYNSRCGTRRRLGGELYQYYPNKQSLLFAIFENHLAKVSQAVEAACGTLFGFDPEEAIPPDEVFIQRIHPED